MLLVDFSSVVAINSTKISPKMPGSPAFDVIESLEVVYDGLGAG